MSSSTPAFSQSPGGNEDVQMPPTGPKEEKKLSETVRNCLKRSCAGGAPVWGDDVRGRGTH